MVITKNGTRGRVLLRSFLQRFYLCVIISLTYLTASCLIDSKMSYLQAGRTYISYMNLVISVNFFVCLILVDSVDHENLLPLKISGFTVAIIALLYRQGYVDWMVLCISLQVHNTCIKSMA